jgi:hypothetical protein
VQAHRQPECGSGTFASAPQGSVSSHKPAAWARSVATIECAAVTAATSSPSITTWHGHAGHGTYTSHALLRARDGDHKIKDYAAFHVAMISDKATERERELFVADKYQDYFCCTACRSRWPAFAELWHRRIREEGFADEDDPTLTGSFRQQYRDSRCAWATRRADVEDQVTVAEQPEIKRIWGDPQPKRATSYPSRAHL